MTIKKFLILISLGFYPILFIAKNKNINKNSIKKPLVNDKNVTTIPLHKCHFTYKRYTFLYQLQNNIWAEMHIDNGMIFKGQLLKSNNNKFTILDAMTEKNGKNNNLNVFNLKKNSIDNHKNFYESILDEEDFKQSTWSLDSMNHNGIIVSDSDKIYIKNNDIFIVKFKKSHHNNIYYREYIFKNNELEIIETSVNKNHYFNIHSSLDKFDNVKIYNLNVDGAEYLLKYIKKNLENKFNLFYNNKNILIKDLDYSITSNNPQPNTFKILLENKNEFLLVETNNTHNSYIKSINLDKKQHQWFFKYECINLNNEPVKLKIIFNLKRIDHLQFYQNTFLKNIYPISFFDNIQLKLINIIYFLKNKFSTISIIWLYIILIFLTKLFILLILFFLKKKFHWDKHDFNFFNFDSTDNMIAMFLGVIDYLPLLIFANINRTSSIFFHTPFLWLNDFGWSDNLEFGWKFFTVSPFIFIVALSFIFFNYNEKNTINYKNPNEIFQNIFAALFMSFILRYFLSPCNGTYLIIQNIMNFIYYKKINTKNTIFRKK